MLHRIGIFKFLISEKRPSPRLRPRAANGLP